MTPRISLSAIAQRTGLPAISTLMQMALANPELISLAAGFVDQQSLPAAGAASGLNALLVDSREGRRALQYGTTCGDLAFRTRLIAGLERENGVPAGTYDDLVARTVITTGSQQLLYLVAEALLDPGDIVLVESPTYFVFLGLLESRGVEVLGIETDEGGLRLEALEETLARLESERRLDRVKLIYTVSEHSNPTGISLAESRRNPLVELVRRWSKNQRIFILEDAAYRGLTFEGTEPSSVWSHDRHGDTVILARTFSKTFSPGLKTGYGVLPMPLVEPVLHLKGNHDFGSSNFAQVLLDRVLADGTYEAHVADLRAVYRRKRDALLEALEAEFQSFDGSVRWTHPRGGLYVWLTVPEGLDTGLGGPLFARSLEEGVLYVPGAYAFAEGSGAAPKNHARLCFGVPSEAELQEGIRRLAVALAGCLNLVA
jgi:2-aminoadipate transaminase